MIDRDGNGLDDRDDLRRLAAEAMRQRGFVFPDADTEAEVASLDAALHLEDDPLVRDLRAMPWTSIDYATSRDLDQLEWVEPTATGARVWVAIAEVARFAPAGGRVDRLAGANTTSVYTAGAVFAMLPTRLAEDLTSLLEGRVRRAWVTVLDVTPEGHTTRSQHFPAVVKNQHRLVYDDVSAWLDGEAEGVAPAGLTDAGLGAQLRLQDTVASWLRARRQADGALGFTSPETELVHDPDGRVVDIVTRSVRRANRVVEELMLAVNRAVATHLAAAGGDHLRRVVAPPERWDRLRELAASLGGALPASPDPGALSRFLDAAALADPARAEELQLTVRRLIGRGEYRAWRQGDGPAAHFALAVDAYAHSTAPNRRYPDLVAQRCLDAVLRGAPAPYDRAELEAIAARCTARAVEARKVERQMDKSAAALFLSDRVGATFDAVLSGINGRGTWVRLLHPAVEGRLVAGAEGLDVGAHLRVTLRATDVARGYLDFVVAG